MATLKICDWFKTKIGKDEEAYTVMVGEHEFEVGEEGLKTLLKQLEGEDAPGKPKIQVIEKIVEREAALAPLQADLPGGLDVEVRGDPFQPGPGSMPKPIQGNADDLSMPNTVVADDDVPPLEIPDSTKKRFKMPTPAQADKIIADSTRFEEGGLPSLTMGGKKQKEAMRKLREIEAQKERELQRSARGGIRVNTNMSDKPGFYD